MSTAFHRLEDIIQDDLFPDVDLGLRRGRHIGREDGDAYAFLHDALDLLEPFYRRFGAELVHRPDGYFYLLPSGDRLGRSQLGTPEMLVGQALALLYLDPTVLASGGAVERDAVLVRLQGLVGEQELIAAMNPRRRKHDDRVGAELVRARVGTAVRALADLGFVQVDALDRIRLRPALLRFAEPVRENADIAGALERLIARGELDVPAATPSDENDDPGAEE